VRHTKIIATVGPASREPAVLGALIAAGVDVVRLNFSHGDHASHAASFHAVREAAAAAGRFVAILQDLSGPKIRTGRLTGGQAITLRTGEPFAIAVGDGLGGPGRVWTAYAPLARGVSPGDRLLIDDGRIELKVSSSSDSEIQTTVVDGGVLGEHKGISAPGVPLPSGTLTAKDATDLAFGLALGVDLVALSFVQSRADIDAAREVAAREGRADVPIVAKLERPQGIEKLDEILAAADAVMVARGDLGLEVPLERVPRLQKEILRRARAHGVPAIVATQVLESMTREARPTRAEVSDAAAAVVQGADAVMLSGETAVGDYPVKAVETLDAIMREAEADRDGEEPPPAPGDHASALCDAAVTLAKQSRADAIIAVTREGRTGRLLSMRRPRADVFTATDGEDVARRMAQWWGAHSVVVSLDGDVDAVATRVIEQLQRTGRLAAGATVVLVNATPDLDRGAANFLRIRRV
jgi:pyruvate kinase